MAPSMGKHLDTTVNVMFVLLGLLALGWAFGMLRNPVDITSRPVRLAYVICDFAIVIPSGVVAGIAIKKGKAWGYSLFPFVLGALFFDTAHGIVYLHWDNYFGIPIVAGYGILLVLLVYTVFAWRCVCDAERPPA